ncbi:alpha/beta fold hydrolase [Cryptosporangium phraense]|uniref:Alpha/beta hydrolase n=1 Tax=Cryptosporangium phraense TaxID=2593070 RepID=A0A545AFV9_9ACTN|nr:alpha/beta hydrolase [Cryptosporangium phraense]TQS40140.1 alpha/beta hydrolase [Cryptosporangium phraense]
MITHHHFEGLHYVSAGEAGPPILLVHGFPESWWAFHELIPLLATDHRVFAVDLPGFGESAAGSTDSASAAEDLHRLIAHLDVGPVHLTGQDISGATVYRLAANHPDDVLSLTAIEMGLAGYGLEALADVTHGGAWYIGMLAAPGVPEMLLPGREQTFLSTLLGAGKLGAGKDVEEFARGYARPDGWSGAIGLYRSMLREGAELRALPELTVPVLAVGSAGGPFTEATMAQVATDVRSVRLDGVGHYVALEAPEDLARILREWCHVQRPSGVL